MSDKIVVLNGKRFVVGNSKIKSIKCHKFHNTRKKALSVEDIKKRNIEKKKNDKIAIMSMPNRRKSKRVSRKIRD